MMACNANRNAHEGKAQASQHTRLSARKKERKNNKKDSSTVVVSKEGGGALGGVCKTPNTALLRATALFANRADRTLLLEL